MARVFNNKVIAKNKASVGDDAATIYRYRGFSSTETKKNFKLYDYELVKQDIINHFKIRKGEKLENPKFGTIIWDMLFEQFTNDVREAIAKDVQEIINFDKRVQVNSITVDTTEQGMRIEAELVYLPLNIVDTLVLDFDNRNNIII
jgi:phage baseplate assembly protein W